MNGSGSSWAIAITLVVGVAFVFVAFGGAISTKIKGMINTGEAPPSPSKRPPPQQPKGPTGTGDA